MVKDILLVIWEVLVGFVKVIFHIFKDIINNIPLNKFDLLTNIISDNFTLTDIKWLDSALVSVAKLSAYIVVFVVSKFIIKLSYKASAVFSFVIFIVLIIVLESTLFWIVVAALLVILIAYLIVLFLSRKKSKQNQTIKPSTDIKNLQIKTSETVVKEKNNNPGKCPLCNSDLKYKNGRYGFFIGCANFPKCNYSTNIDKEMKRKLQDFQDRKNRDLDKENKNQ